MKKDLEELGFSFKSLCTLYIILKDHYKYYNDINFILIIDDKIPKFKEITDLIESFNRYGKLYVATVIYSDIPSDYRDKIKFDDDMYILYMLPITNNGYLNMRSINDLKDITGYSVLNIVKNFMDNDKDNFNKILDLLEDDDIINIKQYDFNETIEYMMRTGYHNHSDEHFLKFCNLCYITNDEEDK